MPTSQSPITRPPTEQFNCAHLFPGQGDFSVSTLVAAVTTHSAVRKAADHVFAQLDPVARERGLPPLGPWLTGPDPPTARNLSHAPPGTLQMAAFSASMTVHHALCSVHGQPSAAIGVSFGEIPALTAAGALSLADGARAAHDLGVVLTSCPGGLTLIACTVRTARELIDRAGAENSVVVAVINDDHSVVVAGPLVSLARVEKAAADAGAATARLRLPFSSHHPALSDAAETFTKTLRAYDTGVPRFPVYSALTGRTYRSGDDLPRRLADCLVRPASVPEVLLRAVRDGTNLLLEAGTGCALTNSARRVLIADSARIGQTAAVHAPLTEPDFPWARPLDFRPGER